MYEVRSGRGLKKSERVINLGGREGKGNDE